MRIFAMALAITTALSAQSPLVYPATRKVEVVDDFFGTKVADPYRWLEDDNSAETKAWVEAQNQVTFAYLAQIPQRAKLRERLTRLWNYERFGTPFKKGRLTFYTHNSGLQNQAVLFATSDPAKPGRVLLDPNGLSQDGTAALSGLSFSEDGRRLAYSVSRAGSDWQTWKVRDVATGRDLADEIRWSKFSGAAWKKDGSGFFYSRYDAPGEGGALTGVNKFQKVYFHRLGTEQARDRLVYERKDQADWGFGAQVTEDGRWLVISQSEGTDRKNRLFLKDLSRANAQVEPFLDAFDAQYSLVGSAGEVFFLLTDKDAPRNRLVAVSRQAKPFLKELIPEAKGTDVLAAISLVGRGFVATWMRDAHSAVSFHGLDGTHQGDLSLPTLGTVGGFQGRSRDLVTYYVFTSFAQPATIYRLDLRTRQASTFRAPKVDFDPSAYDVKQVFYPSKDGTKIPMFLVHKKGLRLDGQNPTLLYGYGGFDISLTPGFSVTNLIWLELGGVYAMPNLRGGGEYGKAWHDAGRLEKKQNVFDDFIAAAEWLIREKVTTSPRLAIKGGSNGGLLVGACMTQRPDLFGAAIPEVGVLDMLRYHRFTIGWAWKSDYLVADTKAGFEGLMTFSPLHTLKPGGSYPATLVTTGDHDDRVVPAHSHKFIATLQACQAGPAPVLTRIETNAGHGAGKPTDKQIAEASDVLAFLVKNLGMQLPPGFAR